MTAGGAECLGDSYSFSPVPARRDSPAHLFRNHLLYFFACGRKNRGDRTPIKLFASGYREIPGLRLGRPVDPERWGGCYATIADMRNFSNVSTSFWRRPPGRRTHRPTRFPADLFRLRLNSVIAAAPAAKSSTDVGSGMVSSYTVPRLLVPPCSVVP